LFRLSALAVLACLSLAGADVRAQAAKKAPLAAEGNQNQRSQPAQGTSNVEKRGWGASGVTCNAQPRCTASPSGQCVAVQQAFKEGIDRNRALAETIRRCERANRPDSACGCIAQCRSVARCS